MDNFIKWTDLMIVSPNGSVKKLDSKVIEIIEKTFKFTQVSIVQNTVIPLFLQNKDVCVKACTGSGKTLSFVVPLVERLLQLEAQ